MGASFSFSFSLFSSFSVSFTSFSISFWVLSSLLFSAAAGVSFSSDSLAAFANGFWNLAGWRTLLVGPTAFVTALNWDGLSNEALGLLESALKE